LVARTRRGVFDVLLSAALALAILATLYPLWYIAVNSLSGSSFVIAGSVYLLPRGLNVESYRAVLRNSAVLRSCVNTLLYTAVGTVLNLVLTAMCAYPLSIHGFLGRRPFTLLIVFTMLFSGGLIPRYLVVQSLGLIDTLWAVVLPTAVSTWYMFIMRTYFTTIPQSLRESAFIDGASDVRVMLSLVLPLSTPVIAALTVFYSVGHWNSFFPALIYLNSKQKYPLQLILRNYTIGGELQQFNSSIGDGSDFVVGEQTIKYAVIMVSTLPIILVYPFMQRHFVKGITIGAVKG
jgi:putative aldouronate transport system permease protein